MAASLITPALPDKRWLWRYQFVGRYFVSILAFHQHFCRLNVKVILGSADFSISSSWWLARKPFWNRLKTNKGEKVTRTSQIQDFPESQASSAPENYATNICDTRGLKNHREAAVKVWKQRKKQHCEIQKTSSSHSRREVWIFDGSLTNSSPPWVETRVEDGARKSANWPRATPTRSVISMKTPGLTSSTWPSWPTTTSESIRMLSSIASKRDFQR